LDIKGLKSGAAVNNRLEEAYIVFTLWVAEGFFGDISPKPEQIWMKPGIQMWDHSVHSHKKNGEIATRVPSNGTKAMHRSSDTFDTY